MKNRDNEKRGQTTIFIIIAVVIVALVIIFIAYRSSDISTEQFPPSLEPVYSYLLGCIEEEAWLGIRILEAQGGYIELPEFEPGSAYMPFSSQLDFLGTPIPYWYYVSGNNVQKEQIPSESAMRRELSKFVEERIKDCDFDIYSAQGFEIEKGEPRVNAVIRDDEVEVKVSMDFIVRKGFDSAEAIEHTVVVDSSLGSLYGAAREVYDKEQQELFLENRGVDVLRLYAPVDGVELSCSPLTWEAGKVFDNLEQALEANTFALKSEGDSDDYFNLDLEIDHNARFLTSKDWPTTFEVAPAQGELLLAEPVGNQPGLGILGFCYVPYHFVYDLKYPVLVQIQEGEELFQFPVAIVIQGNVAREPLGAKASELAEEEFCKYKNTKIEVNTYDINRIPVESEIFYECAGAKCYIGKTHNGKLLREFPQCVNGKLVVRAEGYEEISEIYSSVESGSVEVYLNKIYEMGILLKVDGKSYTGEAIISFLSNKTTRSVAYPGQKSILLSGGEYDVQVYIYENSSLELAGGTREQCVEVPRGGIGGLLGLAKKQCYEVEFPTQLASKALVGGGMQTHYLLNSELESSTALEIRVDSLPKPESLEDLQVNYVLFENKGVLIDFK
jgi:hypothetical protein